MTTQGGDKAGIWLSNVLIQQPSNGEVLAYSSGNWVNTSPASFIGSGYATVDNTGFGLDIPDSSVGSDNVWLGYQAGLGQTGFQNTIVGSESSAGTTANNATIVGSRSFGTGDGPMTIVGAGCNASDTSNIIMMGQGCATGPGGDYNIMIGDQAGSSANGSINNICVGYQAGNSLNKTGGSAGGNTLIGDFVQSQFIVGPTADTVGSTIVGLSSGAIGTTQSNVIFGDANVTSSNTQILVGSNITSPAGRNSAICIGKSVTIREDACLHLGGTAPYALKSSTAAAAGGASALPATPAGYLVVYINNNGTRYKIPYYIGT